MAFQDFMKQLNTDNNPLGPDHLVTILNMTVPVGSFSLNTVENVRELSISNVINPLTLVSEHVRAEDSFSKMEKINISTEIIKILSEVDVGVAKNDARFIYKEDSVEVDVGLMKLEIPYNIMEKLVYHIDIKSIGRKTIHINDPKNITEAYDLESRYYSTYLKLASFMIRHRYLSESLIGENQLLLEAHRSKNNAANLLDLINPSNFFDVFVTARLRRAINNMSENFKKAEKRSVVTEAFRDTERGGSPSVEILTEYSGSEVTHYMLFQYKDLESKTQPFWVNINNI